MYFCEIKLKVFDDDGGVGRCVGRCIDRRGSTPCGRDKQDENEWIHRWSIGGFAYAQTLS